MSVFIPAVLMKLFAALTQFLGLESKNRKILSAPKLPQLSAHSKDRSVLEGNGPIRPTATKVVKISSEVCYNGLRYNLESYIRLGNNSYSRVLLQNGKIIITVFVIAQSVICPLRWSNKNKIDRHLSISR